VGVYGGNDHYNICTNHANRVSNVLRSNEAPALGRRFIICISSGALLAATSLVLA
jgi:hypothetical protein